MTKYSRNIYALHTTTNMRRRIVLDTNCLIVVIPPRSKHHKVWTSFVEGGYDLCVSNEILKEYEEIIAQKSGAKFAELVIELIVNSDNVIFVTPQYRFNLIEADKDDNKFVDCAIVANAEYIVSEDKHFKILETIPFPKVSVIRLDDFMEILSKESAN